MRKSRGNTLLLVIVTIALVVIPLILFAGANGLHIRDHRRLQDMVEAAGLLAANDASKMIFNDPNFGFVSLSNYPPVGKGTRADDGESLPVVGINTLVGTVRQNALLARELGNGSMASLAESDRLALVETMRATNVMLRSSMSRDGKRIYSDIDGGVVDPVKDVMAFLNSNLPPDVELESVQLSNGWLAGDAKSDIPVPQPVKLAEVQPGMVKADHYKAFVDVPVNTKPYTFAALDATSKIVSPALFRPADDKHICSIIRLECIMSVKNLAEEKKRTSLRLVACCQPFSCREIGPAGIMTVRFSGTPVQGLQRWSDFLQETNFRDTQITRCEAVGGDFPIDKGSRVRQLNSTRQTTTAQQFGEHLYYFLRNGHLRARMDAVLAMLNDPFIAQPDLAYIYEFTKDGSILRRILPKNPFQVGLIADCQDSIIVDTTLSGGYSPVIIFHNDVAHLGTMSGGKHAGQPLTGDPLDWCELRDFGGNDNLAQALSKGRLATKLTVTDAANPMWPADSAHVMNFDVFRKLDGRNLISQPRKNFYSGGLALDIEIGGIRESTAALDVASMRNLRFKRKV
jgi:hypothetical protein